MAKRDNSKTGAKPKGRSAKRPVSAATPGKLVGAPIVRPSPRNGAPSRPRPGSQKTSVRQYQPAPQRDVGSQTQSGPFGATINRRAADRLRAGHLWVYASDVVSVALPNPDETMLPVADNRGLLLGTALYSPSSQIALRLISRDACTRLRVLPLQVGTDGTTKVLRVAMADPTDTSAILELEQLTSCEIEVTVLPLSAIEELVEKGYKQFSTAVVQRPRPLSDNLFVTARSRLRTPVPEAGGESEVSVTAQIPLISLTSEIRGESDLEARFAALCQLLVTKGVISESELADVLKKTDGKA